MHIEGPQTYQINRQTNSFQNMYDMLEAKVDRLARKIERQTVDARSKSEVPQKTWGYDGSN